MVNILVDNYTSLIKYQGGEYIQTDKDTTQKDGDNTIRVICDMNSNNSTVFSIDEIDGFTGNKYKYIDGEVVVNSDYIAPGE